MDNNQNAAEKCDAMHNTVHAQCQMLSVANISSGCASCLLSLKINIHPLC